MLRDPSERLKIDWKTWNDEVQFLSLEPQMTAPQAAQHYGGIAGPAVEPNVNGAVEDGETNARESDGGGDRGGELILMSVLDGQAVGGSL